MKKMIQTNIFGLKTTKKKKCIICREIKKLTDFYKYDENNHRNICIFCFLENQKEQHQKDPIRKREYILKNRYKLTIEDFNQMLNNQNRRCKICGTKTPRGKGAFHVDHNHKTNEIRGLLCNNCNRGLGYFNDNSFILFSAINYLRKTQKS